jgi:hypothetical protein
MYDGKRHGIPREEDEGGGRDNDDDDNEDNDTDGTDNASVGNLPPPGGI